MRRLNLGGSRTRTPRTSDPLASARRTYGRRANDPTQVRRPPPPDRAFNAELLEHLNEVMQRGEVHVRRLSFGVADIEFDLVVCRLVCHTQIEWVDEGGKRRLLDADHAEHSAKHGALLRLLGRKVVAARMVLEGFQIDMEDGGTLHLARIDGGVSFEIDTLLLGPALF